ncbi:MAG: ABC transporter substrate-binding protein [Maledivibacter sp.]|nr:ABC transporter substrate-binding protein [Maledivibacter sp.]
MSKKIKATMSKIFIIVLIVTMLSGCGQTPNSNQSTNGESNSSQEVSSGSGSSETQSEENKNSHYPVTLDTYNAAREKITITIEKEPEKVYVACQNNIEAMLKLGLADKIVACYGLDGEIAEDLKDEFAKVNYLEKGLPKEDVIAMQPDFILGWYSLFLDKRLGDVNYWHENGTNTYMSLNSSCRPKGTPQKVEDEMQDILNIGKIFNVEEKAQALVDEINTEIEKIQKHIEGKEKVSIAVLEDESGSYRVYGANTLGGDIALSAGAELKVGAENSSNISAEDLITANPEAIFMVWYEGFLSPEEVVKSITDNPAFASLDAVKNNKVFPLNLTNIYCSGLRSKDGILEFAQKLYPELYK